MLTIIFFSLAAFLAISLLVLLITVPVASYIRRHRLMRREPHDILAEIESEFDRNSHDVARAMLKEISMSIGIEQNRLQLSDRFECELAIFESKGLNKLVEAFDLDWKTVCDDWRVDFDESEFELEFTGSIRESIRNAQKHIDSAEEKGVRNEWH